MVAGKRAGPPATAPAPKGVGLGQIFQLLAMREEFMSLIEIWRPIIPDIIHAVQQSRPAIEASWPVVLKALAILEIKIQDQGKEPKQAFRELADELPARIEEWTRPENVGGANG